MEQTDPIAARRRKLDEIRRAGIAAWPERYERTHRIHEALALPPGAKDIRLAGRLMLRRKFGKLTFAHIQDLEGRIQIALERARIGDEAYASFARTIDIGDFLGVSGELFRTKTGELTLAVDAFVLLGKALRPLPEKFHGLQDVEAKSRQRYLDLIMNDDARRRVLLRTRLVRALRRYLEDHAFIEVETPVLQTKASGALATPFVTHHEALDLPLYLRIAPETYLKRLIVGGFDRIFELGRCFRNEGMDASHLQDFTM
ncbi:MAG: lysine--tRNA ligase, partial [Planctomycetes bacterium]|nr:lysine--tRNA ligase [Planctomycetota bacterium]